MGVKLKLILNLKNDDDIYSNVASEITSLSFLFVGNQIAVGLMELGWSHDQVSVVTVVCLICRIMGSSCVGSFGAEVCQVHLMYVLLVD